MPVVSRNVSFATVDGISALMDAGSEVTVSSQRTKELLHRVTVLERPLERFLFIPERCNDVFAQIAEALWVVAGRNDVEWLSRYLPRAGDFSADGGVTWRGAYGPRLRRWGGAIDQFDAVRRLLTEDPMSRRAVMSLFDPQCDFAATVDIPCNNWLSWIVRDGRLHLAVAVRSNDAVWGFSGANAFEWSVLHEMLAHWLGVGVGQQTWLATSFHVYDHHWDRAERIVRGFHGRTPYDFGLEAAPFHTRWDDFDSILAAWFEAEAAVAADPDMPLPTGAATADPFLAACLGAIRLRWGAGAWGEARLRAELAALPPTDVAAAVWEHFARSGPDRLAAIPHPRLAAYFAGHGNAGLAGDQFKEAVKRLHARKDRAYGSAWKRRGELVSVLPNVARKVDRLEVFLRDGFHAGDEAVLDTALDLYVYATKYRLLLEEKNPSGLLPPDAPAPFSDRDANFDLLVDGDAFAATAGDPGPCIRNAVEIFELLWRAAADDGSVETVRDLADQLRQASRSLVAIVVSGGPGAMRAFVADEALRANDEGLYLDAGGPR